MIDMAARYGHTLPLEDDERLIFTMGPSFRMPLPPGEDATAATVLQIRKRDLDAFTAGRISLKEFERRVMKGTE